ncbi:MAG: hypothetical protein OHK0022_33920 [Roseiflexaceae bacterium]
MPERSSKLTPASTRLAQRSQKAQRRAQQQAASALAVQPVPRVERKGPALFSPADLLTMQRTVGNRAVGRMLRARGAYLLQRVNVTDTTPVGVGGTIPAIGPTASQNLGLMPHSNDTQKRNKLAYIISLPSIDTIVQGLRKTALETGAVNDDMNITYNSGLTDHGVANTMFHGGDWTEINIEIGPSAFQSDSLLYSTIRHELIHAAQHRRTDAKEQDWNGDVDSISNTENVVFNLGSYQPYASPTIPAQIERNNYYIALNQAISEMETHRWEYQHADFTGYNGNAEKKGRGEWWVYYANQYLHLKNAAVTKKKTPDPVSNALTLTRYNEYVSQGDALLPSNTDRQTIQLL